MLDRLYNQRSFLFFLHIGFVLILASCLYTTSGSEVKDTSVFPTAIPVTLEREIPKSGLLLNHNPDELIKILFIGNSYTFFNDLPRIFTELMASGGYIVVVGQETQGGWSLSDHYNSKETTKNIKSGKWDYVVLQEKSVVINPETSMFPAVRSIDELTRKNGADTILFMTWGRRDGLPNLGNPDYASMQSQIEQNYREIGEELGLTVAPVGKAWELAHNLDPNLQLWHEDGSHPSPSGTYLAASVFYTIMTGNSPEGLEYTANLAPETAGLLQSFAAKTVLGEPERWYLGTP
jgi:hypothetical protein